ncbi:thioester reductase [Streptomyces sp. NRRL F-5755]|uniref:non-ribosomal peptide synthetase n=1 Tax=Streptomyces sp. NRRL F-5755 TaxID=1519475 RepID=UPI0006AF6076|nr:amino acid adenylation domain-containing protein [Streptomyces sp. NRRL F-5755]KOT88736.1 thioester reductase [Streptomyces sp. NRRL F-5755]
MATPTDTGSPSGSGTVSAIPRWRTEPQQDGGLATAYTCRVPDSLAPALTGLAERLGVPVGAVLLAAHAKVLSALTGETDVLTGRAAPGDGGAHRPCRVPVADGDWEQLVLAAHRAADGAAGPGDTEQRYEVVCDLSTLGDTAGPAGPELKDLADAGTHLVLRVAFGGTPENGLHLRLDGRADVVDLPYAERIAGYHVAALEHLAADPKAAHHRQSLLSADELAYQIDGLAGPERPVPDRRVHELFEERVRQHPGRTAAEHDGASWTYDELNRRANRVAHALLHRGLEPEDVVAVVTERHLDWLAAVLGVFKAGGVYLPVEPHFPAGRIAAMLTRSACRFVLTEPGATAALDEALTDHGATARLLITEMTEAAADGAHDTDPGVPVAADRLAYIYFTSGSTGEPKGAMCEHAGLVNHLFAKIDDLEIGPEQTVAQTAPQCFDISLWQLVSALLVGGRTRIIGQRDILDVRRYVDSVVDGDVEVLQVVPSYLEVMLTYLEEHPRPLGRLRSVSATGEALKKELAERWFAAYPGIKLVNAYGLTETCDDTNHEVMDRVPETDRVPLGPAVNNVRVYVVDEALAPVPLGAPGEIVFSGVCVGRGYINDPERTAAAFGSDPHRPGERLYRSGDIGRWLPSGSLEFLGRRDAQTKIRGFRIEIGEIENRLLRVPGVRDAGVVVLESPDHGKHLVACYAADAPLDEAEIRRTLGEALPAYMVPQYFHHLPALPLTGNGKTDRKALVRHAGELATVRTASDAGTDGTAPRTGTERRLARLWAEVLRIPVESIGRDQHFFESGGTSLSAVRLGVAIGDAVTLEDIVRLPVLSELAAAMDENDQQKDISA